MSEIHSFRSHLPVRVSFGDDAVSELPTVLESEGAQDALAIVEAPLAELASVASALASCADVVVKQPGEPTPELVQEIAEVVRELAPDALVAIGGGSVLDVAKGARAAADQDMPFRSLLDGDEPIRAPRLPLVAVPTTAGTGSEVSGGCVVVDGGRKRGIASPLLRAQHALVDPLLTVGLPPEPTAYTGVDALAQGIGGVIVSNSSPLSVAIGLEAVRHVTSGLARAVRDGGDLDARRAVALGSLMAGLAMNLSDCGADHALGHALGAALDLPHGLAVGLVLAETLEVNEPACAERLDRVAGAMGSSHSAAESVRALLAEIGFPTLSSLGVSHETLDRLVALALDDYCLTVNPRTWDDADVRSAFEAALTLRAR
jgi:alcohol dehydrogenase